MIKWLKWCKWWKEEDTQDSTVGNDATVALREGCYESNSTKYATHDSWENEHSAVEWVKRELIFIDCIIDIVWSLIHGGHGHWQEPKDEKNLNEVENDYDALDDEEG